MEVRRPENSTQLGHCFATLSQRLYDVALRLWHEVVNELRRLNSARMGRNELSRLAPGDRARAVKTALAAHHKGNSRCC